MAQHIIIITTWVQPFQRHEVTHRHLIHHMRLDFLSIELSMLVDARTLWPKDLGTIFRGILSCACLNELEAFYPLEDVFPIGHNSIQESVPSLSVNIKMSTITIWHLVFCAFVYEPCISLASQLLFSHCARKLVKGIFRLFWTTYNNIRYVFCCFSFSSFDTFKPSWPCTNQTYSFH